MDDDDAPPPLSSLADQVAAVRLDDGVGRRPAKDEGEAADDADLQVATTTYSGQRESAAAAPKLKKGFFDAKPVKRSPQPKAKSSRSTEPKDDGITVVKAKKGGVGGGTTIPDFMRVEPDEQEKRAQEMKKKLVDALKPTKSLIDNLEKNEQLRNSFEDPEVMSAVNEIQKDPSAFKKYQKNKKVMDFYVAMASFTGAQLEQMGNQPL